MNKFKTGEKVVVYDESVRTITTIEHVSGELIFAPGLIVHYKQCRKLVKKKYKCPHPHITREKLAEAWIKLNGWESSPWRVDESEMFKFLCKELGL